MDIIPPSLSQIMAHAEQIRIEEERANAPPPEPTPDPDDDRFKWIDLPACGCGHAGQGADQGRFLAVGLRRVFRSWDYPVLLRSPKETAARLAVFGMAEDAAGTCATRCSARRRYATAAKGSSTNIGRR